MEVRIAPPVSDWAPSLAEARRLIGLSERSKRPDIGMKDEAGCDL